jgi:hypothetical protein
MKNLEERLAIVMGRVYLLAPFVYGVLRSEGKVLARAGFMLMVIGACILYR